jgi:hypothetical protein
LVGQYEKIQVDGRGDDFSRTRSKRGGMPRSVAVNVGANTNEPGFRGPIYDDGSFAFVPIPEAAETVEDPPTYGELGLDLPFELSDEVRETPVHLDPEFAEYPCCERYTYGDPYGVKAQPLLDLSAGDWAFFYATLDHHGDEPVPWVTEGWGAYVVGGFRLARDPISGDEFADLLPGERAAFERNAHLRRDPFDAAVLLLGDDESGLLDCAVPLSGEAGTDANHLVTEHSADSGKGPWWRRPLRFDEAGTAALLDAIDDRRA